MFSCIPIYISIIYHCNGCQSVLGEYPVEGVDVRVGQRGSDSCVCADEGDPT